MVLWNSDSFLLQSHECVAIVGSADRGVKQGAGIYEQAAAFLLVIAFNRKSAEGLSNQV